MSRSRGVRDERVAGGGIGLHGAVQVMRHAEWHREGTTGADPLFAREMEHE